MRIKASPITALAIGALAALPSLADSDGVNLVTVPPNSDGRFSVPFTGDVQGEFEVLSVAGTTLTPTVALTASQFNAPAQALPITRGPAFYVRVTSGAHEGVWVSIVSNTAAAFTVDDASVISGLTAGDTFEVYPHQTLASVFPPALAGKWFVGGTQILIYRNNLAALSQNRPHSVTGTFNAGTGTWVGAGVTNQTILMPETTFIYRNNTGTQFSFLTLGDTPEYDVTLRIGPNGDVYASSGYPLTITLADLPGAAGRQVLLYNRAAFGQNKPHSLTATWNVALNRWVGAGVLADNSNPIAGSDVLTYRIGAPAPAVGTELEVESPY